MKRDFNEQIAELWPTIIQAWEEHKDKHPVIECDVVGRKVKAWNSAEYINSLSERTRATTQQQFDEATAAGGIMVFLLDTKKRVLQSQVFIPDDEPDPQAQ